ncbi:hypothetical protein CMI47_02815 [Candidatus Pacearchaeota archaeon]|nr:hypothetical protein [Candidatus Pacearchaeota archaeon]|tara:strand:+ start:249 stop:806 length:558 start_codon:yes stop_codon:yes gene_type:complete
MYPKNYEPDPKLIQLAEQILITAIKQIQQATGVSGVNTFDESGLHTLSGMARDWWDPAQPLRHPNGPWDPLVAELVLFADAQRRWTDEIPTGPFCLRISGTSDYVQSFNPDADWQDLEIGISKTGEPDPLVTLKTFGHPDTLIFESHLDAYLTALAIGRCDGSLVEVEAFRPLPAEAEADPARLH